MLDRSPAAKPDLEIGSHPRQPGNHEGPDRFTAVTNTCTYAFTITPNITWPTGIHEEEHQQKVFLKISPWVLKKDLEIVLPIQNRGL